jgi:hypothetical protein
MSRCKLAKSAASTDGAINVVFISLVVVYCKNKDLTTNCTKFFPKIRK